MSVGAEEELWKAVPCNVNYQVSNFGRVRPIRKMGKPSVAYRVLKGWLDKYGYARVTLYPEKKKYGVHRLVLEAFGGPCPRGWYTNHLDGNKKNNQLENLEWASPSRNNIHALNLGLRTKVGGCCKKKLSTADVESIKKLVELNVPRKNVAARFKIDVSYISRLMSGECRVRG